MKIKLTNEHYKKFMNNDCEELIVDGEKYIRHQELEEDMDENYKVNTYILKRESDGKFFMICLTYSHFGYEDWGFEDYAQDHSLDECEEREIVIKEWRLV